MSLNTSRNQDDEKAEIVTLGSATNDDDSDDYNYHDSDIDNSNESSAAAGSPARAVNSKYQKSLTNSKVAGGSLHDIEYAWRIQLDLRRVGKYRNHVYNRIKKVLNYYGFEKYSSNGNGPIYYRNDDIINHYDNRDDIKDDFIKPILFSQLMIRKIQTQIDDINDEALNKLIENENEKEKAKQNEKDNNNNNNTNNDNKSKKKKGNNEKIRDNFEKTMLVRYQIFYHGHYGDLSISWTAPIGNHYLKKIENNARDGTACQQNNCHSNPNNKNHHNNNNDDDSSSTDSELPKKNKDDSSKTKKKRSMVRSGDYSASDEEVLSEESVSDMGANDVSDGTDPEMSNLKRKNSMCKDNNNNNSNKNNNKTDINKKDNVKNILSTTNQNNNNNELDELSSEFSSATATDNDNDEDDTGVDSVKKQLSFRKRN